MQRLGRWVARLAGTKIRIVMIALLVIVGSIGLIGTGVGVPGLDGVRINSIPGTDSSPVETDAPAGASETTGGDSGEERTDTGSTTSEPDVSVEESSTPTAIPSTTTGGAGGRTDVETTSSTATRSRTTRTTTVVRTTTTASPTPTTAAANTRTDNESGDSGSRSTGSETSGDTGSSGESSDGDDSSSDDNYSDESSGDDSSSDNTYSDDGSSDDSSGSDDGSGSNDDYSDDSSGDDSESQDSSSDDSSSSDDNNDDDSSTNDGSYGDDNYDDDSSGEDDTGDSSDDEESGETDTDNSSGGNTAPVADASLNASTVTAGTPVAFDASNSTDVDGTIQRYEWDFTGDDSTDATGQSVTHNYTANGTYEATLNVTDGDGATDTANVTISVQAAADENDDGRMLWSDPETWGGQVPQEGDTVQITADMNVVLDESPPPLEAIEIDGGNLTFARQDLQLTASRIVVRNRGEFRVGTEENPFQHEAVITLTGSRDDLPGESHCGVKAICTIGGTLSLHGAVDGPTWTQLGETAEAGDTQITLTESVDWEAGDEIALPSTSHHPNDVDRRTITDVDGRTVTLDQPLDHTHYGELQHYGQNDQYSVDERGEVLLLSRNIVVQGAEGSDEERFGGHIMAMNEHREEQHRRAENGDAWPEIWDDYRNDPELMPEISGVELRRMGQEGVLARYPFHWHRYGNADGSYIEDSSIHNSYQRCVTIHGTQNARVENNVAFNVTGHCYFLEGEFQNNEPAAGYEDGTILRENVGALVTPFSSESRELIKSDIAPAAFWMNGPPNSTVVDNVAAGVYGSGFWVDLESDGGHPPRLNQPLGTWDGNVAHSIHSNEPGEEQQTQLSQSFRDHIHITGGTAFLIEGGEGEFTDLTAYKSVAGFWNDDATNLPVRNAVIADTRNALWFQDGGVENSTIVAHTDNQNYDSDAARQRGYTLPEPGSTSIGSAESVTGVVSFYQGARIVNNVFVGYNSSDEVPHGVVGTMANIRSNPYFAAGNQLIDSNPYLPNLPKPGRELTVGPRVIPTADGGLVGEYEDDFEMSEFDSSEYRELRWGSEHITDRESCEPIQYIGSRAGHTFDRSVYSCTSRSVSISYPSGNYAVNGTVYEDIGGKRGYLQANRTYRYQGTLSPDFEAGRQSQIRIHRGYPGDYVVFAFPMEERPELSQVGQPANGDLVEVDSRAAVRSNESISDTRYYWDGENSTLWLRVVSHTDMANEFGTLPFDNRFDLPVKRSRDNGVQFD